jgi:adenylate cyclase
MLRLTGQVGDQVQVFPLVGKTVRIGRAVENEIRLDDPSVSRHHAVCEPRGETWWIKDLGSTNGLRINGEAKNESALTAGDAVKIGTFDLRVEAILAPSPQITAPTPIVQMPPLPPGDPKSVALKVPNATIVRSLKDFSVDYGLAGEKPPEPPARTGESEAAYGNRVFGYLTRLARLLISAESVTQVLERVMALAFEALPVERGFILFRDEYGQIACELARLGDRVEHRPTAGVPVSKTILEAVIQDRVALLSYDALADGRLNTGDSIRLHGIRAAMSAPLWSGEKIIGVMQVDSSVQVGAFGERDLDFLTALSNYAAVAVERLRYAERVEAEKRIRSRFERYHSPAVIDEMLAATGGGFGVRSLRSTEVTVLFADIVGFTAFSERASPEDVARLLEGYFSQTVDAIFANGGTLDKFIGDAVMAFFGAPKSQPDHARRAVEAAIAMREGVERWAAEREAKNLPRLQVRIAVNSGPVVVGDIGTDRRVDYTVLGNTVNVASRLESAVAKPGDIVIGQGTYEAVKDLFQLESAGESQLKGLQKKIEAYRVLGRLGT